MPKPKPSSHEGPPIAIARTLPASVYDRDTDGCREFLDSIRRLNEQPGDPDHWVKFALPRRPKFTDLLHCYIIIGGRARYRFQLASIDEGETLNCWDDTVRKAGAIALCVGPVEKPKQPVPYPGFRGFRYIYQPLW